MLESRALLAPAGDNSRRTRAEKQGTGTMRELRTRWRELCSSPVGTGRETDRSRPEGVERIAAELVANLDRYWSASRSVTDGPVDVVDMFSGCGGMSAGFRALNGLVPAFRFAGAIDIDRTSNRSYEANLGIAPLAADLSELADRDPLPRAAMPRRRRRAPLVLIGCAPCQGFSSYRNREGVRDRRNPLFMDFANVASRLLPHAVVVENVPELLTDRYWRLVRDARALFERCGYYVHLNVHNMAEFGLPQERFRALLVAMRCPFRLPERGFLERERFRTVRDTIADLPNVSAGERHEGDEMHYSAGHKESTLRTIRAVPKDGGSRPPDVGPKCLRRAAERNGRAVYEDVYGRLYWDRPAITITAYARNPASGRFIHPEQDRGLTVREAALLQGFPRKYWFAGSLDDRFRQVGNAVPPTFSAYIACFILDALLSRKRPGRFSPGVVESVGPSFSRLIAALKAGYRDIARSEVERRAS